MGSKKTAIAVDLDGTVRPCCGKGAPPQPPEELRQMFPHLARRNWLALVTGQPICNVRTTTEQLLGTHRCDLVGPDYGSKIIIDGAEEIVLASPEAIRALAVVVPPLTELARQYRGEPDPRFAFGMKSFFFEEKDGFIAAASAFPALISSYYARAALLLAIKQNEADFSINITDISVHKGRVIDHARLRGHAIAVGAGDGPSDRPLLEAAMFPIATYCRTSSGPNPKLAALATARGGYVATQPDGIGLALGLLAAREAGAISF